jgi:hypothetical protein
MTTILIISAARGIGRALFQEAPWRGWFWIQTLCRIELEIILEADSSAQISNKRRENLCQ